MRRDVLAGGVLALAAVFLLLAPFGFRPYGIFILTMWAVMTIAAIGLLRPGFLPAGPRSNWRERLLSLRHVWAALVLFGFVIGGLYGGLFTPTEAGWVGASGAFLISVARGKLKPAGVLAALLQATRTAAAVFTVLIGALLFGYFLTVTEAPQKLT